MFIKKVIMGCVGTFAAISSAQAADDIIAAEPDAVESVRVCNAYGDGYFYIPGTETCLSLGGMVRTEGGWYNAYNPGAGGDRGTYWHTRAQLSFGTASETEYGPLKTDTVLRFDWNDGGTTTTKLLWANISLGGFLVGKQDSQYNLFTGYAGNVINDDLVYDGPYELNQITYNYDAGNGFTAVASLEDSNSGGSGASYGASWWTDRKADHYAPDVVAGAGYKAGAWQFRVVGGYDSVVEEGAVKVRVDADFGIFKAFLMGGYNTDGSKLNKYAGTNLDSSACPASRPDLCGWGDWAVWGGVTIPVDDNLATNVQMAYTDSKIFEATANVQLRLVKGFQVTPEVTYTNFASVNQDQWAGILRFQRNF
ncbi:porin [Agrobacterium rhizogenes]|nr:porin [Rhizobium rhizogenes]